MNSNVNPLTEGSNPFKVKTESFFSLWAELFRGLLTPLGEESVEACLPSRQSSWVSWEREVTQATSGARQSGTSFRE